MVNTHRTRKIFSLLLLIPILLSLTALGMRLPTLSGLTSGKPKPRPRAVIQTQIKKIKKNTAAHPELTGLPPAMSIPAVTPPPVIISAPGAPSVCHLPLIAAIVPARAPPVVIRLI